MKILVTGNAGFIGFHTAKRLLERGDTVIGLDSVNDYYETGLKRARLRILEKTAQKSGADYIFLEQNLADTIKINQLFKTHRPKHVINLAAQAGVRYSLEQPHEYITSNITAFTNILEACRHYAVEHLTYASTSSVYGANSSVPFSEQDGANHPLQFYAATKRANELMAHSYSHLFGVPTTGLRFFTVYGPWGRPDMAPFLFTKKILAGEPIDVFNHGHHKRDFTYIDDLVEGIVRVNDKPAQPDPDWSSDRPNPARSEAPYRIFNIGNNTPINLIDFISALERSLGKTAMKNYLPRQPGDALETYADVTALEHAIDYKPSTHLDQGVSAFIRWYREYYRV